MQDQVSLAFLQGDEEALRHLSENALSSAQTSMIIERARTFIRDMRKTRYSNMIEALLQEYTLDSHEGTLLMMLAEALLRIPDVPTTDSFIYDKLTQGSWLKHIRWHNTAIVNLTSVAMALASFLLRTPLLGTLATPFIRVSLKKAVGHLGRQFVMSTTIIEALRRTRNHEKTGYMRYSYDMLGEAARTQSDAQRYCESYKEAIICVGSMMDEVFGPLPPDEPIETIIKRSGVSIKLSALHPRYETNQAASLHKELMPRLIDLLQTARQYNINVTLDAEEGHRLDAMLDIFKQAKRHATLQGWNGLGLVVQAYLKGAPATLEAIKRLAQETHTTIPVRLVKGAYWDSEIKRAQELGLRDYPVFTRKKHTDASYLALAQMMLASPELIFPQFATHNTYTISALLELTKDLPGSAFEFQKLHGMGDDIYTVLKHTRQTKKIFVRAYAPIGLYEDLLPYLVRRFLENGASTSFLPLVYKKSIRVERLLKDPFTSTLPAEKTPGINKPRDIYTNRHSSGGIELNNKHELSLLQEGMDASLKKPLWEAFSIINGHAHKMGEGQAVFCPWQRDRHLGTVWLAQLSEVGTSIQAAQKAFQAWNGKPVAQRAQMLRRAADLFEENTIDLITIAAFEGGKTLSDCVAEVREAVDFLRYYANEAEDTMGKPTLMPGPTGERNELILEGRGVFACISPWNFPLAIFIGQVAAALVTGNTVVAKAAEQTPIMATYATTLLHQAGIPTAALHLLIGSGETIGAALVSDARIGGVVFTGSVETAHSIQTALAQKRGAIVPLIAETGGQNAMIVDSSALPEQVVADVLSSAFQSAGQRCSALRVLFVQQDIADKLTSMLVEALATLKIGNPSDPETDVGPLIDAQALERLERHKASMIQNPEVRFLGSAPLDEATRSRGTFFAPCIFALPSLTLLKEEIFGPCLHIITYNINNLDDVIAQINQTEYGLTAGIHSRIESRVREIATRLNCGNIYVNRNIIGAIVGTQPFGGRGLSGTGPKAGGPHYLLRFITERVITTNLSAIGGDTQLLMSVHQEDE